MLTLYGMTGSCSMAIHALLLELNQPVKVIDVRVPDGQPRPAEFLAINPRGNVPVLIDEGHTIREGAAIALHVLKKFPGTLMPHEGFARAEALEWLMFANATLHPAYARIFFIQRHVTQAEGRKQALAAAFDSVNRLWAEVNERLATRAYLCGDAVTPGDLFVTVIANWGQSNPAGEVAQNVKLGAHVKRLLKAVTQRPAFAQALAEEAIDYKAAA